ncbi:MAG: hypothetical protein HRT89_04290 [Lentisphaeria bacterium]|nr:hypothetical protein [Lentisphaeria bacterium]NQZ67270.1 hypothetical protein [Lentisphaeria bacterium]
MPSYKRLKSITQSIAHHSSSALSFVHPHLGEECKKQNRTSITVDFTSKDICEDSFLKIEEINLSLHNLKETFYDLITKEGFECSDVKSAILIFTFMELETDPYWNNCTAHIKSKDNREYEYEVSCVGKTI